MAAGVLGIGPAPDLASIFGITLLVAPTFTLPIQLGGTPGVAGVGTFSLPS